VDPPVDAVVDFFVAGPAPTLTASVATNDDAGVGGAVWSLLVAPSSGTLVFRADGSFDYTAVPGSSGAVGFTYRLCNADLYCDDAVAVIQVVPVRVFTDGFED
jgi:hypothetical protein